MNGKVVVEFDCVNSFAIKHAIECALDLVQTAKLNNVVIYIKKLEV